MHELFRMLVAKQLLPQDAANMASVSRTWRDMLAPFSCAIGFALTRPRWSLGEVQVSLRYWVLVLEGCFAAVQAEGWDRSVLARGLELTCDLGKNLVNIEANAHPELLPPQAALPLLAEAIARFREVDETETNADLVAALVLTGHADWTSNGFFESLVVDLCSMCLLSDGQIAVVLLSICEYGHDDFFAEVGIASNPLEAMALLHTLGAECTVDFGGRLQIIQNDMWSEHPLPAEYHQKVLDLVNSNSLGFLRRRAWDGNPYTYQEFWSWYWNSCDEMWMQAASCDHWGDKLSMFL